MRNPEFKPDLIILDLNIPRIPSAALPERWKGAETPVVVFSASENPIDGEYSTRLGARAFVSKPAELQQFNETVCAMLEKSRQFIGVTGQRRQGDEELFLTPL